MAGIERPEAPDPVEVDGYVWTMDVRLAGKWYRWWRNLETRKLQLRPLAEAGLPFPIGVDDRLPADMIVVMSDTDAVVIEGIS